MICKHCGAELPEGYTFCPHCGTELRIEEAEPVAETALEPVAPVIAEKEKPEKDPVKVRKENTILILGIIGLAGNSVNSIGALIVSILALKRYAEHLKEYADPGPKARIGSKLARAGKIVAIVTTAFVAAMVLFYLTVLVVFAIIALTDPKLLH